MKILLINSVIQPNTIALIDGCNIVASTSCETVHDFRKVAINFLNEYRLEIQNYEKIMFIDGPGKFNDVRCGFLIAQAASLVNPSVQVRSISCLDYLKMQSPENCFVAASKSEVYGLKDNQIVTSKKPSDFSQPRFELDFFVNNISNLTTRLNPIEPTYGKQANIDQSNLKPAYVMLTMTLVLIMVSVPLALTLSNLNTQSKRLISASLNLENAQRIGQGIFKEESMKLHNDENIENIQSDIQIDDRYTLKLQHFEVNNIPFVETNPKLIGTPVNQEQDEAGNEPPLYTMPAHGSGNTLDICKKLHHYPLEHQCNFWQLSSNLSLVIPMIEDVFPLELQIKERLVNQNPPFEAIVLQANGRYSTVELEGNQTNNGSFTVGTQDDNVLLGDNNSFLILRFKETLVDLVDAKKTNKLNIQFRSQKPMKYISNFTLGQIYDNKLDQYFNLRQITHLPVNDGDLGILHQN